MAKFFYTLLILFCCQSTLSYAATIIVTNGNDSGSGSLRQAIASASSGDIINFSGVSVVSLTSDELTIDKSLTIDGGNSKVTITRTGSGQFRIFEIDGNSNTVILNNLEITNGFGPAPAAGINNDATLTVNNCIITGNNASSSPSQAASLRNGHILTMNNCLVINNNSGGILSSGVSLTATNCILAQNQYDGISVGSSNIVTLNNCTSVNNKDGDGFSFSSTANSTLTNCTFSCNGKNGASLFNRGENIIIKNCIFSDNGESSISGSGLSSSSTNNLLSGETSSGLANGINGNIIGTSANHLNTNDPDGDDNQWFTADDGYSLSTASFAIDAGTNNGILALDIAGNARPHNSGIADIGAYEFLNPIPQPTVLLQPTNVSFCDGENTSITCIGQHVAVYKWQQNNGSGWTDIQASTIYSGENTTTLLIDDATGLEGRQYRCVLFNILNDSIYSDVVTLTNGSNSSVSYPFGFYGLQTGSNNSPFTATVSDGSPSARIEVSTFAGGSVGSIDGVLASARFNDPTSGVFDNSGNLYVVDFGNHRIRKITPAGVVSTFAGSTFGFMDGTGTNTMFNRPTDITIDNAGNLYVADNNNHRIRKITPSGVVTTFAGGTSGNQDGTGTNARFNNPTGITIDASGNLFVADSDNHRIRKITPSGEVTTIAGGSQGNTDGIGPNARFNNPQRIIADNSGNLFVADANNHRIRKVTLAGKVTTLAGSSVGLKNGAGLETQFDEPMGFALSPSGELFVADYANHLIRKITQNRITTYAGSTSGFTDGYGLVAEFRNPVGMVFNSNGELFVMDEGNNRIRKVVEQPPFVISPTLSNGLTFNASTSEISGTPTTDFRQTYSVSTQNVCKSLSTTIEISASSVPPPTITTQPYDVFSCPNAPASFSVSATNVETYIWQVNTGSGWSALSEVTPYSGVSTPSLNISTVNGLNGNLYRCVISGLSGIAISDTVAIKVGSTVMVTNQSNVGFGSLRKAISCTSAGDTILFAPTVNQVNIASELNITHQLFIDGGPSKVTIRGLSGSDTRIFNINTTDTTVLKDLIITDGNHSEQAGGVLNAGKLKMTNCTIKSNVAPQANGLQNDGTLVLEKCLIVDNTGTNGGGFVNYGASTIIKNSVIGGNQGNGISDQNSGGILTIENSLIYGNSQRGIFFNGGAGSSVYNSVVASNATEGLDISSPAANISLVNNIISNNQGFDISSSALGSNNTNNLIGGLNAGGLVNGVNGNLVNVNPQFVNQNDPDGPDDIFFTADDGFSISTSSPAFNAGTNANAPLTDIIGNVRPFNGEVADIGAYEILAAPPAITNQPVSQQICPSSGASFSVVASFADSYQWQVKVGAGAFTDLANGGVYSNVTSPTLNISNINGLSGNQYRCVVTNTVGSGTSDPATLTAVAASLTLANPVNNISGNVGTLQAQNSIEATNLISAGGKVMYESGKAISLNPGFSAANGAVFTAKITQNICQ